MTICNGVLQYTTHILSCQSKSNELRETREVFFQWLVDLYRRGFSIALIVHSLDRYPLRCWLVIRGPLAYSLFIRLPVSKPLDAIGRAMNWISMGLLSPSLFIRLIALYSLA